MAKNICQTPSSRTCPTSPFQNYNSLQSNHPALNDHLQTISNIPDFHKITKVVFLGLLPTYHLTPDTALLYRIAEQVHSTIEWHQRNAKRGPDGHKTGFVPFGAVGPAWCTACKSYLEVPEDMNPRRVEGHMKVVMTNNELFQTMDKDTLALWVDPAVDVGTINVTMHSKSGPLIVVGAKGLDTGIPKDQAVAGMRPIETPSPPYGSPYGGGGGGAAAYMRSSGNTSVWVNGQGVQAWPQGQQWAPR